MCVLGLYDKLYFDQNFFFESWYTNLNSNTINVCQSRFSKLKRIFQLTSKEVASQHGARKS